MVCYILNSRPVRVERADSFAQMPRFACLPNYDVLRLDYFTFLTDWVQVAVSDHVVAHF